MFCYTADEARTLKKRMLTLCQHPLLLFNCVEIVLFLALKWVIEGARTPDPQNHNLML